MNILKIKNRLIELFRYGYEIGFFHLVSASILLKIAGSGMQFVLMKILPLEDIGRITILQSFLSILILVAQMGVGVAILKLCSEQIEQDEKDKLVASGLKFNVVTSVIIVLCIILLSYFGMFSKSDVIINNSMRIYILQLPFVVLNSILIFYLQSQNRIKEMSRYQIITRLIVIISILGFSAIWGFKGYVIGIVISNFVGFILISKVAFKDSRELLKVKSDKKIIYKLLNYSKFALIANIVYELTSRIGVLMTNYLLVGQESELGIYGLGFLMVMTLMTVAASFNQIMVPRISNVSHDLIEVKKMYKDYRVKVVGLVGFMIVMSYIFVPILLNLIFGSKFDGVLVYFRILLIGLLFWSVHSPIGNTLLSIGKLKLNIITNTITLTCTIIINFILIPRFQVLGIAYSYVLANGISMVISLFMIRSVLNKAEKEETTL